KSQLPTAICSNHYVLALVVPFHLDSRSGICSSPNLKRLITLNNHVLPKNRWKLQSAKIAGNMLLHNFCNLCCSLPIRMKSRFICEEVRTSMKRAIKINKWRLCCFCHLCNLFLDQMIPVEGTRRNTRVTGKYR